MMSFQKSFGLKVILGSTFLCFALFLAPNCLALDSFTISATRPSKAFACSSVIGDARRKSIDLCKKRGQKVNYETYEVPIVCEWETLSGQDNFKATIEVKYECRNEED